MEIVVITAELPIAFASPPLGGNATGTMADVLARGGRTEHRPPFDTLRYSGQA
jgi:hypothetical protein